MLHAVIHGKAGRVSTENDEELSWRELFRKREDLLTATFFGRLRYLSEEGERKVLALLVGATLADELGSVHEIVFWPKLKGLEGRKHVEPDVVLFFEKTLLLIEVKPPFGGKQHEDQWRAQIQSMILQKEVEGRAFDVPDRFYFLALGRNVDSLHDVESRILGDFRDDGLEGVRMRQWAEVCHAIHSLADADSSRDSVIYDDWISAFMLFGMFEQPKPFADLLAFTAAIKTGWQALLASFNVPKLDRVRTQVDWKPLAEFSQRMNIEGESWE